MTTAFQQVARKMNDPQTKNLIIWSGKGGTGKTTFAQNVAYWLAAAGRKVGLADTDSGANSSNYINMLAIPPSERLTLSYVVQQNNSLLDVMYQVRKNLWVIPSDDNIEAANGYIVANELQEIMIDKYNELIATLAPRPLTVPSWHRELSLAPRFFSPLAPVEEAHIRELPTYLDYIIWDFPGEPGALCRAILRLPNSEIWSPVKVEPLPMQGFAQMRSQVDKLFRHNPQRKPLIAGVVPYELTHKKEETAEAYVKLYVAQPGGLTRAVHEDLNVPPTQDIYPAQSIFEVKRTSRAARELFEIAMRIDGYTGQFDGGPVCKHCDEIAAWIREQSATA